MMCPCLSVCKLLSRKINIFYKAELDSENLKPEQNPSVFLTQPKWKGSRKTKLQDYSAFLYIEYFC